MTAEDEPSGAATDVLRVGAVLVVPLSQIEMRAVRSQGAGGQNVNKTSTAIHLRFDVMASSLPDDIKRRLLARRDQRLSDDGVVVIKAQQFRSQEQNRDAALARLAAMIEAVSQPPRPRKATRVPRSAQRRRVDDKTRRGTVKRLRRKEGPTE